MNFNLTEEQRMWQKAVHDFATKEVRPMAAELDETQEINFPPIMKALLDIGYQGFVGHEFIPTRDPLAGLTQAVRLCDV